MAAFGAEPASHFLQSPIAANGHKLTLNRHTALINTVGYTYWKSSTGKWKPSLSSMPV